MIEVHPYYNFINEDQTIRGGFVPKNTSILIVGTFPPQQEYTAKGEGFFYYSSERNHLWNRLDNIFLDSLDYKPLKKTATKNFEETFLENRSRKMKFATKNGIGFIDIFSKIGRSVVGSTADADIISFENILENGFLNNILEKRNIKRICCVYALAYTELITNLPKNGYTIRTNSNKLSANSIIHTVSKDGKSFELVLLYPATRSSHKGQLKDHQYSSFLFNDEIAKASN